MLSSFLPRIICFWFPKLAAFVGGSSDFFEIAAKVVVVGFVAVGAFDVVQDDTDGDISDVAVVAVRLNLLLVLVVLL